MFKIFKKKKEEIPKPPEIGRVDAQATPSENPLIQKPPEIEKPFSSPLPEPKDAKIDLIVSEIENIKLQYKNLEEKINNIEEMVKEIYRIAKS